MTCTADAPGSRRTLARWLAALMLAVALGPLVSGALAARHTQAVSADCALHAGHGMPCPASPRDDAPVPAAGHCPLCLVLQHPPLLADPPAFAGVAALAALAPGLAAAGSTLPHDRAQRWLQQRQHAPPVPR